ncbi:hypothetical protein CERZMDRAFT_86138 [Cercospora zeae-maydis SCOH1-5]|uniref:GPI anchored serine-threonine rich protein n=1 Tax=Cercospora zeae-maydis SCOH1-5 TaxID=717836 RepID=A0A6A6FAF4_9PEZI|nr:hypothetical protein CERZMDRAFT_86138 [Cercospora zeae-maydis SCOH1-5]
MHASAALVLAVAGLAAAQTTSASAGSTSTSGCGSSIDLIIESCLGTTKSQFDACAPQDWDCLCEQANNVLTCYNNCPSAPDRFGYEQTKVANCNAASAYGSKTSSATGSATGSASGSSPSNTAASTTASNAAASTSGTRTGSAAAETSSGSSAAHVAVPGLAALLGLAAFL